MDFESANNESQKKIYKKEDNYKTEEAGKLFINFSK